MEVLLAASCLLLVSTLTAAQGSEHRRPLWILEDCLAKRQRQDRPEEDYATTTRPPFMGRQTRGGHEPGPITFLVRHEEEEEEAEERVPPPLARRLMPSLPQRRFMMPHRLQLPHQYVQPNQHRIRSKARSSRRTGGGRHLPVFDNAPGENTLKSGHDNYPVFVYNGTRGELILNTMLSRRRYPMQEPVPGQVLYPPSTPMFRPKPIVERFRLPGQREMLNLTLIPFYAHEAISKPSGGGGVATQAPSTTQASPTPPPLQPYETQLPRSQKQRKRKKAKRYEAFHSPQEVMQWQTVLRRHAHEQQDRDNHRHYSSEEQGHEELLMDEEEHEHEHKQEEEHEEAWAITEQETETETEMELPPEPEAEISTTPSSGPFQIVYLDDSLERPVTSRSSSSSTTTTTTDPPPLLRQSSRYALKREYYAFPVYTLGKLLQPQAKKLLEKSDRAERGLPSEREPHNTWFILNSRYKGPHHHRASVGADNQTKYYTSKYVESGFRPRR